MDNATVMDRLERASHVSTVLMALGAIVVLAALVLSYDQLRTLQTDIELQQARAVQLRTQNNELRQSAESMRKDIQGLREALRASRIAIEAFHLRDYARAVTLYDQALRADPNSAYLINLKAYALYKLDLFDEAVKVQEEGIKIDPGYAYGFFELARIQCAQRDFSAARKSIQTALKKRPDLRETMENDGEFQRECAEILK